SFTVLRGGLALRLGRHALDMRAEGAELGVEMIVATLDVFDAVDGGGTGGAESSQDVGRARANVGHGQLGGVERRWPANHTTMVEVALAEPAGNLAQAASEEARIGAHAVEVLRIAETVLIDRLVDDRHPLRLG